MPPFGVTVPAIALQRSEIPEGLMNYSVYCSIQDVGRLILFMNLSISFLLKKLVVVKLVKVFVFICGT